MLSESESMANKKSATTTYTFQIGTRKRKYHIMIKFKYVPLGMVLSSKRERNLHSNKSFHKR